MTELSFVARLVLTLLLSVLFLFSYKWMQSPNTSRSHSPVKHSHSPVKRSKKRNKKKPVKAAAGPESLSPPQQSPVQNRSSSAAPPKETAGNENENHSDSESDDGRSAAQVLATRKFKPTSLSDSRLTRDIEKSLPAADARGFSVDQKVLARFGGGDRWFPATVLERRKGNQYHLKYDDGEVEYRVPSELIKPQRTKSDDDENNVQAAEAEVVAEDAAHEEEEADSVSSVSDEDGWQVVGTSTAAKRSHARRMQTTVPVEPLVEGLTKRQRENRRKKERQREKKELLRQHAQKDDLDARARWRYVPS